MLLPMCPAGHRLASNGRAGLYNRRYQLKRGLLNGNAVDHLARDHLRPPVIQTRRPGIGVPRQSLHVFESHALIQQVGDGRHAKAVCR